MSRFDEGDRAEPVVADDPSTRPRPGGQGTVQRVHSDPWPAIDGDQLRKLPAASPPP